MKLITLTLVFGFFSASLLAKNLENKNGLFAEERIFVANLLWRPSSTTIASEAGKKTKHGIEGKTIETVLSRKNPRYVKAVLGDPDRIKRYDRRVFFIYDNPELNFKDWVATNNDLVIVFINGMVSDILYKNQKNKIRIF